jgi:copper homeostasis protein
VVSPSKPFVVEVAVDSVAAAETAVASGAHRLELCQALELGGLSPSLALVEAVLAAVQVPVFVMVRPRAGDFLYDRAELAVMAADLAKFAAAGAHGFVTGMLWRDGSIDAARMRELLAVAEGRPVTCHRAFDLCADAARGLETLIEIGVARVLTSGQAMSVRAGTATIRDCVERANGRIGVIAGAGVRDTNVRELFTATGVREVHLSATTWRPSAMTFRRSGVMLGAAAPADEYACRATDGGMVARVINNLPKI